MGLPHTNTTPSANTKRIWRESSRVFQQSPHGNDRVECRGLRPGTLPHHRTCGFPHPAVEASVLTTRQIRWHKKAVTTKCVV